MAKTRAMDHKCPACGAPLLYVTKLAKWKCGYCDSEYTLDDLIKLGVVKEETEEPKKEVKKEENVSYDTYLCKDCGAEIIADENTVSTFCLYCGNTAILKNKLSGEFKPDKLIPFKVVKEDAINAFKALKKGRPLLPKDFVSEKNIEKITGLYVPFWLYDITYFGGVTAKGTKVTSWTSGDTHYTKTDTYRVERELSVGYNLVPVDGSEKFADDIMTTIEPFDYRGLVDYNHAYLSGFLAEKYDVSKEKAYEIAKKRSYNSTLNEARSSMRGYSTVNITGNTLKDNLRKTQYALLPVFMVNVKYKDKYYLFAMNGQTGEFVGNMPISVGRALAYAAGIFAGIVAFIIIASLVIFLLGGGKL